MAPIFINIIPTTSKTIAISNFKVKCSCKIAIENKILKNGAVEKSENI